MNMSINILMRVAFVNYSKNIGALFQSAQECVCEKGRWCICGRFSLKFPSYSRFYLSIHIFFLYFLPATFYKNLTHVTKRETFMLITVSFK